MIKLVLRFENSLSLSRSLESSDFNARTNAIFINYYHQQKWPFCFNNFFPSLFILIIYLFISTAICKSYERQKAREKEEEGASEWKFERQVRSGKMHFSSLHWENYSVRIFQVISFHDFDSMQLQRGPPNAASKMKKRILSERELTKVGEKKTGALRWKTGWYTQFYSPTSILYHCTFIALEDTIGKCRNI